MLLAALERMTLFALPAFDGCTNDFGPLGRVLPILHLGVALRPGPDNDLLLLVQCVIESGKEGLIVARGGSAHSLLGADCELAYIAVPVGFQLRELVLTFRDAALAGGEGFGLATLEIVGDLLDHLHSLYSFHALRAPFLPVCEAPNRLRVAARSAGKRVIMVSASSGGFTVRQDGLERCEAGREIDTLAHVLLQKSLHSRPECDGVIDSRIATALVGTN
jgi:hypothetical protein